MHIDTVDDRHHQIQPTVDFAGVMNRDDVRFGQPGGDVGFTTKPLPITGFGAQLGESTLIATSRPSVVSWARYTLPMPPSAISSISR